MVTAKKGKKKNKGKNGSLKENNELSAGSRRTVLLYYVKLFCLVLINKLKYRTDLNSFP